MTEQYQQPLTATNRKTRASLATLGLAISMGAAGVLMPRQGDSALATEPAAATPSLSPEASEQSFSLAAVPTLDRGAPDLAAAGSQPLVTAPAPNFSQTADQQSAALAKLKQERETLSRSLDVLDRSYQTSDATSSLTTNHGFEAANSRSVGGSSAFKLEESGSRRPLSALGSAPALKPDSTTKVTSSPDDARVKQNLSSALPEPSFNLASVPDLSHDLATTRAYQVRSGDTLTLIAARHQVSVRALLVANNLNGDEILRSGQVLVVPVVQTAAATIDRPTSDHLQASHLQASVEPASAASPEAAPVVASTPALPKIDRKLADASAVDRREKTESSVVAMGEAQRTPRLEPSSSSASLDRLRDEIRLLRERYGNPQAQETSSSRVVETAIVPFSRSNTRPATTWSNRSNPEAANATAFAASSGVTAPQPMSADRPAGNRPASVAIAPDRFNSGDPRLQNLLGREVSPSLPPLRGPQAYLPNNTPNFNPSRIAGYIWPARGTFTSGYGWRWGRMHRGIDIAAPVGTPVVAASDGIVTYAGWNNGGFGNLVEIRHADGSMTRYAHNNRVLVRVGQQVSQGELVSEMGSTGRSTGPHLHFEVHPSGGSAVNPIAFLPSGGLQAAR